MPRQWRHLTLLEKIGEGQFGEVYRAFDNTLQIEVALKLSHPGTETAADLSSALHEARMLARIHHPNVVRVYGAEVSEGRSGIWMELVRGRNLKDILATQRFSAAEAVTIGIDGAGGPAWRAAKSRLRYLQPGRAALPPGHRHLPGVCHIDGRGTGRSRHRPAPTPLRSPPRPAPIIHCHRRTCDVD